MTIYHTRSIFLACLIVSALSALSLRDMHAQVQSTDDDQSQLMSPEVIRQLKLSKIKLTVEGFNNTKQDFLTKDGLLKRDLAYEQALSKGESVKPQNDYVPSAERKDQLKYTAKFLSLYTKKLVNALSLPEASYLKPEEKANILKLIAEAPSLKGYE